ncbi:spermine/spermidine synthase domain-containing protein [Sneathiella aquimaris]|uniref:spermine/spermidine synthase domain-containing protein n=1 Tax=Sneathiella aquimaris TaxID=2599305 RepID=UPI00146DB041|nr:polyamine aminopropyltransferase [Sneathiella aquimaris]
MTKISEISRTWWHEETEGVAFTHALDMKKLHEEQSPYQKIEIFDHETFGRILTLDGLVQASEADEFMYHEMAVHVPLLGRVRENASVLIVGGGDGGILREVLLHDFVSRVVMVEIDERVVELSKEYLGIHGNYDDPRVQLIIGDAADYMKKARASGDKFDLIILDLSEPVGPSATVFTEEFCQNFSACITDTGVVLDSDSIFVGKERAYFLQELCGDKDQNLVSIMQKKHLLPHVSGYRSIVQLYPAAEFGFFLYSRDGYDYSNPVKAHEGRHYNEALHKASFALPTWWKTNLGF